MIYKDRDGQYVDAFSVNPSIMGRQDTIYGINQNIGSVVVPQADVFGVSDYVHIGKKNDTLLVGDLNIASAALPQADVLGVPYGPHVLPRDTFLPSVSAVPDYRSIVAGPALAVGYSSEQPYTRLDVCNPLLNSENRLLVNPLRYTGLKSNVLGLELMPMATPSIDTSEERLDALTKQVDRLGDEVHQISSESAYWQSQTREAEKREAKWKKRARKAELENLRLDQEKSTKSNVSESERLKAENAELRRTILGYELEAGLSQDIEPPGEWDEYPFSEN